MKKLIFFIVVLFSFTSFAQKSTSPNMAFGAQVGLAVPVGDLSDYANMGFGILGSYIYGLNQNFDLVASIGFISFSMKADGVSGHTFPFIAGGRYYFTNQPTRFYGLLNIGTYVTSVSDNFGDSVTSTDFGFSIGGGFKYPLNQKITLDGNAKYNHASDYGWIDFFIGIDYAL